MKLNRVDQNYCSEGYSFECPGCTMMHMIPVKWNDEQIKRRGSSQPVWDFSGDLDKPTFSPSLLVGYCGEGGKKCICHSFIRDGKIQFLADCTHKLAGQTVELPEC